MNINPLDNKFFLNPIDDKYKFFYVFGNNHGLIDICFSKLKKNLNVDLSNPFLSNFFDENRLLNDSSLFLDELKTISIFDDTKTLIIDIRHCENKKTISDIFIDLDYINIEKIKIIFVSYIFKKSDDLSKKISQMANALTFACYEESDNDLKKQVQRFFKEKNIKLSDIEINKIIDRLSKDSKINQNTFDKLNLTIYDSNIQFNEILNLIEDNNDKTVFELINTILIGNYSESIQLLKKYELLNLNSSSILYPLKSKLLLIRKCIYLRKDGLKDFEIVNNKSLNIFFKEKDLIIKMLRFWSLNKIELTLNYLFNIEIKCKSNKDKEYLFLNHLFLFIYFKIKN